MLQVADEVARSPRLQTALRVRGQRGALFVNDTDFHPVHGITVCFKGLVRRVADAGRRHGAILGHAPGRNDMRAQMVRRPPHQSPRNRRARGKKRPQTGHRSGPASRFIGHIRQERRSRHRKGHLLLGDQIDRLRRVPYVLENNFAPQRDWHYDTVHKSRLMRQRRSHQNGIIAIQPQPCSVGQDVGIQRIGGMHHPLRLPRRAGCIKKFDDIVRSRTALGEPVPRVEQRFERATALAADDQHMFQRRQVRTDGVRHRFIAETAIFPRDHQHFRFRKPQHEPHLPLPEDRHDRVGNGPAAAPPDAARRTATSSATASTPRRRGRHQAVPDRRRSDRQAATTTHRSAMWMHPSCCCGR